VNGATAQVVNFMLAELLPAVSSEPLPPVIVWGDGSRAFNEGRPDQTWASLVASPGYQAIRQGLLSPVAEVSAAVPAEVLAGVPVTSRDVTGSSGVAMAQPSRGIAPPAEGLVLADADSLAVSAGALASNPPSNLPNSLLSSMAAYPRPPLSETAQNLDALGFSAVSDRFTPQTYYQQFPRVNGRYDGAYSPFVLNGEQTTALSAVTAATRSQNARLIFVNLPLSGSYLDDYRLYYESEFQQFLRTQSQALGFDVIDLLTQWQTQPALFADPSHINQDGAAAIARQLAQDARLIAALNGAALNGAALNGAALNNVMANPVMAGSQSPAASIVEN
jgi:hypothetical protein